MIVNPYVKNPNNIKWLTENEETFIKYMSEHHSPHDLAHTFLHMDTLDDKYISNMINKIAVKDARLEAEEKMRKAANAGKSASKKTTKKKPSTTEKKIADIEQRTAAKQEKTKGDDFLLD